MATEVYSAPQLLGGSRVFTPARDSPLATNLCLQSDDLSVTWVDSLAVNTQNSGIAPDGTNTMNRLNDDSSAGTGVVSTTQAITLLTSTAYVLSVELKADQLDWAVVQFLSNGVLVINSFFDLTDGAEGASPGANNTDQGINRVAGETDGVYRCWVAFTTDAVDTTGEINIALADADTDAVVDLDGTSSILVRRVNLELGTVPAGGIKTKTTSRTLAQTQSYIDPNNDLFSGSAQIVGSVLTLLSTENIRKPSAGASVLSGAAPSPEFDYFKSPGAVATVLAGVAPTVTSS